MVVFTAEFKEFLRSEAEVSQGEESEGSIAGYLTYGEWQLIWAKTCKQYPDCDCGDDEDDQGYDNKVIYPYIS